MFEEGYFDDLPYVTSSAVDEGNESLLEFLLNYGLVQLPHVDNITFFSSIKQDFMFLRGYLRWNGLSDRSFQEFQVRLDHFINCRGTPVPRLKLLYMAMNIILFKMSHGKFCASRQPEYTKRMINCFNLVSQSSSQPAITVTDINALIGFILDSEDNLLSQEIRQIFGILFPGNEKYINPRSLLELSRCQLRDSIQKSSALPGQVWKLPLPNLLKDFLLFKTKKKRQ